jgi:butyryl-CoA dehydrogenase
MAYVSIVEEISACCAAIGLAVSVHNSVCLYPLLAFGNREQQRRWAPALARGRNHRRLLV